EMEQARRRHEAEIAMLRERRLKAIADLESLAESLLSQAARGNAPKAPDAAPGGTAPVARALPEATISPPAPPPEGVTPKPAESGDAAGPTSQPAARDATRTGGDTSEDEMLAKALDDLEAVL